MQTAAAAQFRPPPLSRRGRDYPSSFDRGGGFPAPDGARNVVQCFPDFRPTRGHRDPPPAPRTAPLDARSLRCRVFGRAGTNRTRSGPECFTEVSPDCSRHLAGQCLGGRLCARRRAHRRSKRPRPSQECGTPTAAASSTASCPTAADSSSAGPMRLPAMFIVSSERPCRNQYPSSSTEAQSPWHPDPRQPSPVRVEVALGIAPEAARHPGEGLAAHELPDLATDRAALGVDHVHRHPQRGPAERAPP